MSSSTSTALKKSSIEEVGLDVKDDESVTLGDISPAYDTKLPPQSTPTKNTQANLSLHAALALALALAAIGLGVGAAAFARVRTLEAQLLALDTGVLVTSSPTAPDGYTGSSAFLGTGSGEWAPGVHLPYEVSDLQSVMCAGKIFLLGGLNTTQGASAAVVAFDPVLETYDDSRSPMPVARYRFGAACHYGRVYVAGGFTSYAEGEAGECTTRVDVYDVAADSWSSAPSLSIARGDLALAVVGGKVHAFGGYGYQYPFPDPANDAHEVLDTANLANGWTPATPLPAGGKGDITAAVVGDVIYLPGGWQQEFLDTFVAYNTTSDTWSTLGSMRAPRGDKAVAVLNDRIFVIGGETWSGKKSLCPWDPSQSCDVNAIPMHTVEMYDPALATWETMAPLPEARFRFASAASSDAIFAFGGQHTGSALRNEAWIYHYVPTALPVYFHAKS